MNQATSHAMKDLFEAAKQGFAPLLSTREVAKGACLHPVGALGRDLFLVQQGLLRSYYWADGRDVTAHFAMEHGLIGAADSLIRGRPSRYAIEALEDSHCLVLAYPELEAFLEAHPQWEHVARKISQYLYMDLVERFEGLLFLSAKERYAHLLDRYPGLEQRVNLGHIASYLGIAPETLSRVRAQG